MAVREGIGHRVRALDQFGTLRNQIGGQNAVENHWCGGADRRFHGVLGCAGDQPRLVHGRWSAKRPENWREWIFVGAPLTPNALNDGEAPFPEYHNVYIEPSAFAHFQATGEWAQGTQVAKELTLIYQNDNDEIGATFEVSGRGYQQGEFAGLELSVKDSERFPDMPGGWAYFSFGHQPEPYNETASAFPADACNACHEANADTDFVFTQFFPILRAAMPK